MLAVGGLNQKENDQDLVPQGLSIFDMTDLTWKREGHYDADAEPYTSPRVVQEWYQDRNLSSMSWASDEVKNMFLARPVNFDEPTSSPSSTTTSPAGSATATGRESVPNNLGPIVGGVAGGVAFLGILAGLVYYFRFRNSKPLSPSENIKTTGETAGSKQQNLRQLSSEPEPQSEKELPTEA